MVLSITAADRTVNDILPIGLGLVGADEHVTFPTRMH
jgi:hypothetical protein